MISRTSGRLVSMISFARLVRIVRRNHARRRQQRQRFFEDAALDRARVMPLTIGIAGKGESYRRGRTGREGATRADAGAGRENSSHFVRAPGAQGRELSSSFS